MLTQVPYNATMARTHRATGLFQFGSLPLLATILCGNGWLPRLALMGVTVRRLFLAVRPVILLVLQCPALGGLPSCATTSAITHVV